MEPGEAGQIIVLIILLCLSAFFSASETALMSVSKIRIRHMIEEGVKGASVVGRILDNPSKLLSAILIGNNVVNIGASALATSLSIYYFGNKGVGIATGVMTLLVLIFGEITPKSLAVENAEKVALKVARILSFITFVLGPIIMALMAVTNGIIILFGGTVKSDKPFITEEELKTIVDVSHEEGVLEGEEKQMIYNVFEFGDSQVEDVMVPRTDMVAIEIESTYDEIINTFRDEHFSRIPVYKESPDNIVGILHIKDIVFYDGNKDNFDINQYIREPFFTFEFGKTSDLFEELRSKRIPMAVVLDEYGGTAGIITMQDLIEEIVGDIQDEYDEPESEIEVVKEHEYIVDGSTKIEIVNEMIGINIVTEEYESIGGFVVGEFGRLPKEGETIQHNNIKFIIENIDKNRIEKLRILTGITS